MPADRADKAEVFADAVGIEIEQHRTADRTGDYCGSGSVFGFYDAFSVHCGVLLMWGISEKPEMHFGNWHE